MTNLIVILIIILLILLLLVLLLRREPHEVLHTLAERITRVKGSKGFDMRFAEPAHRSETNVVSVAITQEASPKPTKGRKNPA